VVIVLAGNDASMTKVNPLKRALDVNKAKVIAFSPLENRLDSLSNTSLKNAIVDHQTEVVAFNNNIKDFLLLIKVAVASMLSINVTFTDNDKD
jgi:hypothetical protein